MAKSPSYLDDYYSEKAKNEGIRARSYYKLAEIDRKFKIFHQFTGNDWVLDLGCCPGSWVQYCLKSTRVHVVGIDLKETLPFPDFPGRFHFIPGRIEEIPDENIRTITGNKKFTAVLSDMAPDTSGNPERDAYLSYELVVAAWDLAKNHLREGSERGVFVVKYFQGAESRELYDFLKQEIKTTQKSGIFPAGQMKIFKPDSSRKNSREVYLIIK